MKIKTKNRAVRKSRTYNLRGAGGNEQFLILKTIAVLISSTLLSVSASVSGFTAIPLCTAFAAILSPFFSAAALTGTVAGIIFTGEVYIRLTDIISVIAVAAVKTAADKALSASFGVYGSGLLAWVAYTVSGLSIAVATNFTVAIAAAIIFRGVLCGAVACAAAKAFVLIKKDGGISFSPENKILYSVIAVIIISSLTGIGFFSDYVNLGRIVGIIIMLQAAYVYGIGGGAAAAALSVFAFMLGSPDAGRAAALLAVGAVAAGLSGEIFSKNKFIAAVSFTVTSLCALIVCNVPAGTIPLVCDIFIGAAIYSAVPEKFSARISNGGKVAEDPITVFGKAESAFFSELLSETGQNFGKVSRLLNNQTENTKNNDSAKASGVFYEMDVYRRLFEGFSDDSVISDSVLTRKIAAGLGFFASVKAGKTIDGANICELFFKRPPGEDKLKRTGKLLEKLMLTEFEPPEIITAGNFTRAVFCEKAPLCLQSGSFEMPLGGMMNGDTNISFTDGRGNDYALLSDGMGSGIRAAIESRMTVSLLQKYIRAGVSFSAAADFVNFLLQAKSDEEMLSTVDLLVFSRFTGKCILFKMGAAKTFARLGGTIRELSGKSLPAGILRDPGPDNISFSLRAGDAVLMITDGVTEENFGKCRDILNTKTINPKTAARRVVEESKSDGRQDDKTAVFIEVKAGKTDF